MSSKNTKRLRSELRDLVKEILPEVTTAVQSEQVLKVVMERLVKLEQEVRTSLSELNQRHKDAMGFLVRSVSESTAPTSKKE